MNKGFLLIVLLILFIGLIGCNEKDTTKEDEKDKEEENLEEKKEERVEIKTEELNFTIENYPKVDGSTSAHPLQTFISCILLEVECEWQEIGFDGIKRLLPVYSEEKEEIVNFVFQNIIHNGTHSSYVNLIEKETDVIIVAREPSQDEIDLAESESVELEINPIALDAFVFILNKENPVNDLSVKEIQDIYTGKITEWNEVGGENNEINAYQRNDNSGSQELMKSLVMKELEIIDAPELILRGMMGPINQLSYDKKGIGYSVYFFEEFMAPNEKIKLCGVNGVTPSYENIKNRNYVYTTEVFVVVRKDLDKESNAFKLREWLLGKDGQKIVKESGYVPIN